MSPAPEGGFFTTLSPGKPQSYSHTAFNVYSTYLQLHQGKAPLYLHCKNKLKFPKGYFGGMLEQYYFYLYPLSLSSLHERVS